MENLEQKFIRKIYINEIHTKSVLLYIYLSARWYRHDNKHNIEILL